MSVTSELNRLTLEYTGKNTFDELSEFEKEIILTIHSINTAQTN